MAKHVHTLLFFILFATECSSYIVRAPRKQSNALEGQFIRAMKLNMKGINQPLQPRKLPGLLKPKPADGCESWPCNPEDDQCYEEAACGPCMEYDEDLDQYICTDLEDPTPPICLEETCGENPNHCTDIGCGECDNTIDRCTDLSNDCDQQVCNEEEDNCEEEGCGDCDLALTSCTIA